MLESINVSMDEDEGVRGVQWGVSEVYDEGWMSTVESIGVC